MQITITGPRGCGKTTVAIEIAKFLEQRGCRVRIVGDGTSGFLRRAVKEAPNPGAMNVPFPVTIIDSFEGHDEYDIKQIVRNEKGKK